MAVYDTSGAPAGVRIKMGKKMPGKKAVKKAVSQKQAGFFGAIAGGANKTSGMTAKKAGQKLKGVKVSKLPMNVKGGKPTKVAKKSAAKKAMPMKKKGMK